MHCTQEHQHLQARIHISQIPTAFYAGAHQFILYATRSLEVVLVPDSDEEPEPQPGSWKPGISQGSWWEDVRIGQHVA